MYLDNAATTSILPETWEVMHRYGSEIFYNPSALYAGAVSASKALNEARKQIARMMGTDAQNLVLTACGTESDNAAILCTRKHKGRVIISATEHAAVWNSARALAERGWEVSVCPVDAHGRVDEEAYRRLLGSDVALISIMHVNNETGAVNDIRRLVALAKETDKNILFHSDGVQALGHIKVNVRSLGVDAYSVSGHKIGAPKGVGLLYMSHSVSMQPALYGGGQERGLRSGTENVMGMAAMEVCLRRYLAAMGDLQAKGRALREAAEAFCATHDEVRIVSPEDGAPHILMLSMRKVRGEVMMHALEQYGIIVGVGSACSTKKGTPRIPKALGLPDGYEQGMLRISINPFDEYDFGFLFEKMHSEYEKLSKYMRG